MVAADVVRLLELRIKRISQYDIDKNRKDIDDIVRQIKEAKGKLKNLVGTVVAWLGYLHDKYAPLFPRRTKFKAMEEIDEKRWRAPICGSATTPNRLLRRGGEGRRPRAQGHRVRQGDRDHAERCFPHHGAAGEGPCSRARSPISTSSTRPRACR